MEAEWGAFDRVRGLYERLLEKTQHVNVFKGYGTFEWRKAENKQRARQVNLIMLKIYGATHKFLVFYSILVLSF